MRTLASTGKPLGCSEFCVDEICFRLKHTKDSKKATVLEWMKDYLVLEGLEDKCVGS